MAKSFRYWPNKKIFSQHWANAVALVGQDTTFLNDKPITDHNRMLDEKVLAQTVQHDIEWFHTLETLIRRAGGYVQRILMIQMWRKHFEVKRNMLREVETSAQTLKKVQRFDDEQEESDDEKYDPKDPSTIEVEKCRKKWGDVINKYRREVETLEKKLKPEDETKKEAKKPEKRSKSKSSKKKGGKVKKVEDEIDLVQCLPVWVGKKILGYLDSKTLTKLKKVNSYWAFLCQDILSDAKMRKKLDKAIAASQAQIDPTLSEGRLTPEEFKDVKIHRKVGRVYFNCEKGAVIEEIIPTEMEAVAVKSIHAAAENEILEQDFMRKPLTSFPRVIKDDVLCKHVPCITKDLSIMFGIQGDIKKQMSFLTYSLSAKASSNFSISIGEQTLSDW